MWSTDANSAKSIDHERVKHIKSLLMHREEHKILGLGASSTKLPKYLCYCHKHLLKLIKIKVTIMLKIKD